MYRRPHQLAKGKGRFCSRACRNRAHPSTGPRGPNPKLQGENNPAWLGGTYIEPEKGYRMVRRPSHHRARQNGYVLEHLLVAENVLGRRLRRGEEVHHIDGDKLNNHPSNLKVYASHREHWVTEHLEDVHAARDAAASTRSGDMPQP
jgi:hypothetical protein